MRTLVLLSMLLVALVPGATAGPLALLPVSEHEEGCVQQEPTWSYEPTWDEENERYVWTYSSSEHDQCTSSDTVSAQALANGDEVAGIEARDETFSGSTSSSQDTYWSDFNGNGSGEGASMSRLGWSEATQVEARAAGERVTARNGCEDLSESSSAGGYTTENGESRGWYDTAARDASGCGISVDAADVRASTYDGCQWTQTGSQVFEGDTYADTYDTGSMCGRQAVLASEAGEVGVHRGNACTTSWRSTYDQTESEEECAYGTWIDAPGTRLILDGGEWRAHNACDTQCSGGWSEASGIVVLRTPVTTVAIGDPGVVPLGLLP